MAAGPILLSNKAEARGIGTMIVTATMIGIAAATTGTAKDKWSRAHRMTCTGTIAKLTPAAECNC
jgi:hypothetical protein